MAPLCITYEALKIYVHLRGEKGHKIHVHAYYPGNYGMKVIFDVKQGKVVGWEIVRIKGQEQFTPAMLNTLKKVVSKYNKKMVTDWIDAIDWGKEIKTLYINKL
jgi:hypothetical protein